jgi:putative tryptophan/tyrosine transport system substrate-binding protein
MRQLLSC